MRLDPPQILRKQPANVCAGVLCRTSRLAGERCPAPSADCTKWKQRGERMCSATCHEWCHKPELPPSHEGSVQGQHGWVVELLHQGGLSDEGGLHMQERKARPGSNCRSYSCCNMAEATHGSSEVLSCACQRPATAVCSCLAPAFGCAQPQQHKPASPRAVSTAGHWLKPHSMQECAPGPSLSPGQGA
jgi:hypothetical protein